MADEVPSAKQRALLEALRSVERARRPVDVDAMASSTGYSPSSIRTYFTKRLEGVLVSRDDAGRWWVRGALACSEAAFARRMSQKAGSAAEAIRTEESWRELVRRLLFEGSRRNYTLSTVELDLMGRVTPPPPDDDEDDDAPPQPTLF